VCVGLEETQHGYRGGHCFPIAPAAPDAPAPAAQAEATPEEAPPAADVVTNKQHPKYIRFFKMLGMQVPEQAVKNQMKAEGLDPTILE
jgi:hypothetical protein